MRNQKIGFFDSGLGGLSIMSAARAELPNEDFVYIADCDFAPYGDQSSEYIFNRSRIITQYLLEVEKVKAVVIACNTATAHAADPLREAFPHAIIVGVEPAIKPAVEASQTKVIGMIATQSTAMSERYLSQVSRYSHQARIISQGCPGLCECVERGEFNTDQTRALLQHYLTPILKEGIDGLVLGCTHYPFLAQAIHSITGPALKLYEPGQAVARHLKTRLHEADALSNKKAPGTECFMVSGLTDERRALCRQLWAQAQDFKPFLL